MGEASLGILLLDTVFPRIPGDIGNALSYDFPVRMKTIKGATVQRAVFDADPTLLEDFVAGARELEAEGVSAITSSCGFLSPLQDRVASAVQVPVFLSSLMQIPLVHMMTGGRIAIITANSDRLSDLVLKCAGVTPSILLTVAGMQDVSAFSNPILFDGTDLQADVVEEEIIIKAEKQLHDYPDIGAFVLECHNLAPYGHAIQEKTGKPVFDIIDFANWVYRATHKRRFPAP